MFITMIGECVQSRAGAPAVLVGRRDVLWPAPSTDGDLPRCLPGGDEVVEHQAEVGLIHEEELHYMLKLRPTGRGSTTESVENSGSHGGGKRRRG